ncbi:TRP-domain-containing protein [Aspergillus eucalypticola CBS 122712]|uniref:TRP-domain-containing protein n=1 Tax=Aspergillus eucalypticola (strain CBS 122712 / IBT 29274) TaxID=1448314 RepID=A0A317UUW9_ASPEC|nr:TRP-domain-containing protein [Aspergillus eucalypticola CBS 122712]PWY65405.1 TRP-domain-containing protein [Aspergillus eucalypticola CBS 122712]
MLFFFIHLAFVSQVALAEDYISSTALAECSSSTAISVNYFDAKMSRSGMLDLAFTGYLGISGNVAADIVILVYGYEILNETISLCDLGLDSLCPMASGAIDLPQASLNVSSIASAIPGIGYTVPDLDATVLVYVNDQSTGTSLSCLSADLSNGHTVYQAAVSWVLAVVIGAGLIGSIVASIKGLVNTATHLSFSSLALLDFMQLQAMIGLCSVNLPPIAQSWTQTFQWTLGIVYLGFQQTFSTWYLRATGGTPSTIVEDSNMISVVVEKRDFSANDRTPSRSLLRRASSDGSDRSEIIVKGINRMAYRAGIEPSNIFMTSYSSFIFVGLTLFAVLAAFQLGCRILKKFNKLPQCLEDASMCLRRADRALVFRFLAIALPSITSFGFWELSQIDSSGIVVLAVTWWTGLILSLAWTTGTTIFRVQRARKLDITPAYVLYSGMIGSKSILLHIHYRANAYYFSAIQQLYIVTEGLTIAASQSVPKKQAIILVVINAIMMGVTIWIRPCIDGSTNRRAITTAVLQFLNSICVLIFSDIFGGLKSVASVVGVIYCIYNAIYMLVLVMYIIIPLVRAVSMKNLEARYEIVKDNRESFINLHKQIPLELQDISITA